MTERTVVTTNLVDRKAAILQAQADGLQHYHSNATFAADGTVLEWTSYFNDPQPDWLTHFAPAIEGTGITKYNWASADVDIATLRTFHMNLIREVRNRELFAKDIEFMRAVEAGDTDAQATIGTEKQVLRDIPATFDITTDVDTPAALHAKWPSELPARE